MVGEVIQYHVLLPARRRFVRVAVNAYSAISKNAYNPNMAFWEVDTGEGDPDICPLDDIVGLMGKIQGMSRE